jgi:hypothetical protein
MCKRATVVAAQTALGRGTCRCRSHCCSRRPCVFGCQRRACDEPPSEPTVPCVCVSSRSTLCAATRSVARVAASVCAPARLRVDGGVHVRARERDASDSVLPQGREASGHAAHPHGAGAKGDRRHRRGSQLAVCVRVTACVCVCV